MLMFECEVTSLLRVDFPDCTFLQYFAPPSI
jgi:hypothetical protein